MPNQQFKCRYNPDHPPSTSAQALGHHYRTEHADVHTVTHDKRVQCRHCGKVLASSSVSAHLQTHHGIHGTNGQRLDHRQHVTTPDHDTGSNVISIRTMQTWYRCRMCGQEMTANNIGRHIHKTHHRPDVDWHELAEDMGQREAIRQQQPSVQCDLCGVTVVANNLPRHMAKVHNATPPPTPPVPTATTSMVAAHLSHNGNSTHHQHEPWKADDIVLPVVEQLTLPTGLLPVAQLAAVLAWRDATTTMLATLARGT